MEKLLIDYIRERPLSKLVCSLLLCCVTSDVLPDTTLNTFIRSYANLPGTKHMCNEGGCGSCVVCAEYKHPVTKKNVVISVNSCLVLVYACHGWSIRTVEGIGNKKNGYNKIQTTLANFNGTQCGYCSPGFVMNMYSLLKGKKEVSMEEVEKAFSGHICRCTGYRPILDAFKSFATDASEELKAKQADIEDLLLVCPNSGIQCYGKCQTIEKGKGIYNCVKYDENYTKDNEILLKLSSGPQSLKIESNIYVNKVWYKAKTVQEIFEILSMVPDDENYMLVAGNTAQGAYRNHEHISCYIDIKDVPELRNHKETQDGLYLGANMTLNETMLLFEALSNSSPDKFSHLKILANHIELVANMSVRNVGTLAGNLMLKRKHPDFPSDIFLTLETVGTTLQIANEDGITDTIPVQAILEIDMDKKLISNIVVPALPPDISFKTFKIMPREQNAPATLNAGFLFNLDKSNGYRVITKPSVVIGGISPHLIHATEFENFLIGKDLFNDTTLQEAFSVLDEELISYDDQQDESFEYKKRLAEALFYRFVLSLNPDEVESKYKSGAYEIERGLSKGHQEYSVDKTKWPINKPMPKVEALSQCSGEAEYINDIPHCPEELQGALVVTKLSKGKIKSIDASPALKIPGVVAFYSAKDIPGENTFFARSLLYPEREVLFCNGDVLYTGQPVGIIVAETREIALKAADQVKIDYTKIVPPKLHVKKISKSGDTANMRLAGSIEPEEVPSSKAGLVNILKGSIESPSQYHFTMEVQSCLCVPKEGELFVYSSSQWINSVQEAISVALNIPVTKVNMSTKRLGGAYGSKISRASMIATSCSLASYILQRPVRLVLSIETNMEAIGKRNNSYAEYQAGVAANGKILLLNVTLYSDKGISYNESSVIIILESFHSIYDTTTWSLKAFDVKTDKPTSVWARAPGTVEKVVTIETIMEHVASVLKKDPLDVRMANLKLLTKTNREIMNKIAESADLKQRKQEIEAFNKANRWKKKGISLIPMEFTTIFLGPFHAMISVYSQDGSVTVSHGGIEMGQGINTKVSQVVAAKLGIELEKVSVKATNSITSPNNNLSGGSTTTENVCKAATTACDEMLKRLEPIKKKLGDSSTWLDVIKKAHANNVDLVAAGFVTELAGVSFKYKCYGAAVSEVEIDLLTGKHLIHRTDILEDVGESINPEIDVGQVEGAFVMGLGLFTSEELKFDEETGVLKTNRTWNYHPPGARDIPKDFRVTFLKNGSTPSGIYGSKAIGEPPLLLATTVLFAIRDAVKRGREDAGDTEDWFEFHPPFSTEKIFLDSLTSYKHFKLKS